jgi:hypothetical protein
MKKKLSLKGLKEFEKELKELKEPEIVFHQDNYLDEIYNGNLYSHERVRFRHKENEFNIYEPEDLMI